MKKTLTALLLTAGVLLLTGCTTGPDMTTVTAQPTGSPSPEINGVAPQSTDSLMDDANRMMDSVEDMVDGMDQPGMPAATHVPESTGVTGTDKARRAIEQIEEELERLSEVDDAEVIIAGNKAAVALEFDDQYKGGVDDRLRGIVKDRIDGVISGISTIAVTSDSAVMETLEALGETLENASDMAALKDDLDAVIRKINGGKA